MVSLTLINKKLNYTAEVDTKNFSIKSYCEIQQEYRWSDTHFISAISDESFSDGFWVPKGVWDNLDLTKTTGTVSGTIKLRDLNSGDWNSHIFSMPAKITISKGNDMKHSCGSDCNVNGSWLKLSIDFDIKSARDKIISTCGYTVKHGGYKLWNVVNFFITLNSKEYWSETITQGASTAHTVKKAYGLVSDITEAKDLSGFRVYRWDEDTSNWSLHHFYPTLDEAKTLRDTLEDAGDKVKITQLDTAGTEIKTIYETGGEGTEEPGSTNKIFGYVKGPLNNPLQFATVSFGGKSSTTNSSGYYEITDVFSSGQITASIYGYKSSSELIIAPAEGELQQDFQLVQETVEHPEGEVITYDFMMGLSDKEYFQYWKDNYSYYGAILDRGLMSELSPISGDGSEASPFVYVPGTYKNDLGKSVYVYFQTGAGWLHEGGRSGTPDAVVLINDGEWLNVFDSTTPLGVIKGWAEMIAIPSVVAGIIAYLGAGSVTAASGTAAVSNWGKATEVVKGYATAMGTATFALFILEEACQTAGMGVWQATKAKEFGEAKMANERLKLLSQQGVDYCSNPIVALATPFTVGPFLGFFQSSLKNYDVYDKIIEGEKSSFSLTPGETYQVYIFEVIDGDTFKCYYDDGKTHKLRVRWAGINTPEKGFKEGKLSRDYAKSIVEGKTADILMKTMDPYGRYVCTVFIDGENINRKLVEEGMAYAYPEGTEFAEPGYHELELIAREQKIGIFSILNEYNIMTGDVSITSKPSYCKIFVDDADTGRLTAETIRLTSGGHVIRVEKEGYEPSEQSINIAEGDDKEIRFELTRTTGEPAGNNYGTLKISSKPSYAFIDINGARQLVLTPETLKLPPGTYDMTISKPGFVDAKFSVTMNVGELQEKRVELAIA